jgi:DNA repair protein RadA/Sms
VAKKKQSFVCISCGAQFGKWAGRCPNCNEWNSIVEAEHHAPQKEKKAEAIKLSDISDEAIERIISGNREFDIVCGGGIVKGAVTLIGGEPGIGKSTLSLQLASHFKTLYISGEESPVQVRQRAQRIEVNQDNILIATSTIVENIEELVEKHSPEVIFVDSIQTVSSSAIPGPPGSIAQLRESAIRLTQLAKERNLPLFLIGHITKEGSIAGPKILEHVVDTVLYFEGDFNREYRILRSFKNRFGSVNEIGLFAMTDRGLAPVQDKNALFLSGSTTKSPGTAIGSAVEGSRTILFEVQSLVTQSAFPNPRRTADGLDFNRLIILLAALERYAQLKLSAYDVFINLAGGFSINETSSDLAVALSIASGCKNTALDAKTGFIGEISLSGDIRPVSRFEERINEFERNGFETIYAPAHNTKNIKKKPEKLKVISVSTINEVIKKIF